MICATVKAGSECAFMTKSGCGFNGGSCHPIVDQCEGCQRVVDLASGRYCNSYPNPAAKWRTSVCNFASHAKASTQAQQQAKINPLKASKRSTKRK
ncbi:MAG TPA: PxxKW family cysteine-rich protein [Syntrophobacteraceae bacterium]|nr:PxxKW family cysteine-rich protein [Syntrophobacteraceae bacterium]